MWLEPAQVVAELFRGDQSGLGTPENAIVWQIRLPRAVAAAFVGGLLGVVGAAFQALFRNPLADPYVLGVSSGAAVGGTAANLLGFGTLAGGLAGAGAAFVAGLLSLWLVVALASRRGRVEVSTMLVAGVVVGALLSSMLTLLILASGEDSNRVLRWLLGSLTPMTWGRVALAGVAMIGGGLVLFRQTRRLNAFAVGEASAQRLGVDPARLRRVVLVAGTALAAVAVGVAGVIPFLGLVAPHIARRLVGVDLRPSLPAAAFAGMAILTLADVASQRIVAGSELPVGAVTAVLGAPALLVLLRARSL